jgi:hypothetical protein
VTAVRRSLQTPLFPLPLFPQAPRNSFLRGIFMRTFYLTIDLRHSNTLAGTVADAVGSLSQRLEVEMKLTLEAKLDSGHATLFNDGR